jgi:hypothetical protein
VATAAIAETNQIRAIYPILILSGINYG